MYQRDKSCLCRLRIAAGLAVLAGAACALPAAAQQIGDAATADAMTVVRDAHSGKLRAATSEEAQALHAARASMAPRMAPAPTLQKYHPNGARGVRLTDEFMSESVAVRNPDGSVQMQCLEPGHSAMGPHSHPQSIQPVTE